MAPLHGVHRVRRRLASGVAVYWYAWRGGPCILAETARTEVLVDLKVNAAAAEAGRRYFEVHEARKAAPQGTILALAKQWRASPEFKLGLSARTQRDYGRALTTVEADLGTMPVKALKADGARAALLAWRNRYAETPAKADQVAGALSKLLGWARDQGLTSADPMRDWPWIYHPDRSEILYIASETEQLCRDAGDDIDLQLAILAAASSGLRKCDLLRLPKTAIGAKTVIRRTSKRGRVVHVPITEGLRQVLDLCLARSPADCLTVLTNAGRPWKSSTLDKRWMALRDKSAKAMPSIAGKRWHDFRGTYATSLHRDGYEDDEVDRIMGWKKGNSEQTRAAYVAGDVVAHTAIARAAKRLQLAA